MAENYEAIFRDIIGNRPLTVETFRSIESQLNAAGIKILSNARGSAYDIVLPDGSIIDVVQGFDGPVSGRQLQWSPTGENSSGGAVSRSASSLANHPQASHPAFGLTASERDQFAIDQGFGTTASGAPILGFAPEDSPGGVYRDEQGRAGRRAPPGAPIVGFAVPKPGAGDGIPGVLSSDQKKGAARAAAQRQRRKAGKTGRRANILGGFGGGTPTVRRAVLTGR
jgi:hypothetical protein